MNEFRVYFQGDKNVLKVILVKDAQLREYLQNTNCLL